MCDLSKLLPLIAPCSDGFAKTLKLEETPYDLGRSKKCIPKAS